MTAAARNNRLLLAAALLLVVVALWWFGRVNGPAPTVPPVTPAPATATPAPLGQGTVPISTEEKKATAAAPWREAEPRTGVDASNIYKDAFVLFGALTEAEKTMLRSPKEEVDADAAAALFEKIQPILAKLREAMKADYCDWGVAPISYDTPLTYMTQAQDLGMLALWSAAYRLHTDPANALEDLQTRARLGHHLSDFLIGGLVSMTFEATAANLLRENLGSFDAATRGQAVEFIARSSLDTDLRDAFHSEAEAGQRMVEELQRKSAREQYEMCALFDTGTKSDKQTEGQKELMKMLASPEQTRAEAAFLRATQEKLGASLALPEAEFQAWWKALTAEIETGHPLARTMLPALGAVQQRLQQRRVERVLFAAGADVLEKGVAQLANYRDPATGKPLQYVPMPNGGFELRASYEAKGKPVTLAFPAAR